MKRYSVKSMTITMVTTRNCPVTRNVKKRCPTCLQATRKVPLSLLTGEKAKTLSSVWCKVWVDMRLTPPTDTAAVVRMVEQAIAAAEAAVPGCRGTYTVTGDRPAIERDPNSPLLAALKRAADDVTDADTTVGFFTGDTDTAVIAGKTGNRQSIL